MPGYIGVWTFGVGLNPAFDPSESRMPHTLACSQETYRYRNTASSNKFQFSSTYIFNLKLWLLYIPRFLIFTILCFIWRMCFCLYDTQSNSAYFLNNISQLNFVTDRRYHVQQEVTEFTIVIWTNFVLRSVNVRRNHIFIEECSLLGCYSLWLL
jgi:hypothetical protein